MKAKMMMTTNYTRLIAFHLGPWVEHITPRQPGARRVVPPVTASFHQQSWYFHTSEAQ